MSRLRLILMIALPSLRVASLILANRDVEGPNAETGIDDETAAAISFAADRIEKFLASPEGKLA